MLQKKILVIDDSKEIIAFCKMILSENYSVISAENVKDGIEAAERESPDLILLDLSEEFEKGCGICKKLTQGEATRNIPVVILYLSGDEEIVRSANSLGVVDYIPKPIIPTLLLKRVQTVIERYSGRINRCGKCFKPMQVDWSFCPYDGTRLPPLDSRQ